MPRKGFNLSFGIYWRKFFLFAGLFVVGLLFAQSLGQFKADTNIGSLNISSPVVMSEIRINNNGSILIDGKETGKEISFLDQYDELRMPVIDSPTIDIDIATISLVLPGQKANLVKHEILGIHGVGETSSYVQNDSTIIYQAKNISVFGEVSIIAQLPKGIVKPSIYQRSANLLPTLGNLWLILAFVLPLGSFIYMLFFILSQIKYKAKTPQNEITEAPPMAIPPAVVGVLCRQKVGAREIAATLIDLAIRGNILIIDRSRDYGFTKNKLDKRLLGYEKLLLAKIFKNNIFSNKAMIDERINAHVYSKKISLLTVGIYALATQLGYFKKNPQVIYARYKFFGAIFFIIGLAGFSLSIIKYSNTSFLPFLWLGMIVSVIIVTFLSQKVPVRSDLGQGAYIDWLSFKKFLCDSKKIEYSPSNQIIFQKYLPYAIALECEVEWAKRFSEHNFTIPEWFVTEKSGLGLEDFCLSIFPIVSYVSRSFAAIREPGFR